MRFILLLGPLMSLCGWLASTTHRMEFVKFAGLLALLVAGLTGYALYRERTYGDKSDPVSWKVAIIMFSIIALWLVVIIVRATWK